MVPNFRAALSEFCVGFLSSALSSCKKRAAKCKIQVFIVLLKLKLQMAPNLLESAKSIMAYYFAIWKLSSLTGSLNRKPRNEVGHEARSNLPV